MLIVTSMRCETGGTPVFFMHFWANDKAATLDKINLAK